jgi:integrase
VFCAVLLRQRVVGFRDIRAKAATDIDGLTRAQKLLGHKTRTMTEHYTRNRKGDKVSPLK